MCYFCVCAHNSPSNWLLHERLITSLPVPVPLVDPCLCGLQSVAQLAVLESSPVGVLEELVLEDSLLLVGHLKSSLLLLDDGWVALRVENLVHDFVQVRHVGVAGDH